MTISTEPLRAVGVAGSPARASRSSALVALALEDLARRGAETARVELAALPADALLGRATHPDVTAALGLVGAARILVVGTPVYRATYSGLLKVFFDLLPPEALAGKVAVPIATGGSPAHLLAVDVGLRPLLASVGAVTVSSGVYGTDAQFSDGTPAPALRERVERAVAEAVALAAAIAPVPA